MSSLESVSHWNTLAGIFDTQSTEAIDPRAADNILIAWPEIFTMLQDPSLQYRRPVRLVLDFGCGTGAFVNELAKQQYHVYGIDPAEKMIAIAKSRFPNVVCTQGRVYDIPYDYTYDAVTAIMVFQFVDETKIGYLLTKLVSHLPPGAQLIFAVHNPDYLEYAKTMTQKYFKDANGQWHIQFKEHGAVKLYPRSSEEYTRILEPLGMRKHAECTPPFTDKYIAAYGANANEPLDSSKFLIMSFVKDAKIR